MKKFYMQAVVALVAVLATIMGTGVAMSAMQPGNGAGLHITVLPAPTSPSNLSNILVLTGVVLRRPSTNGGGGGGFVPTPTLEPTPIPLPPPTVPVEPAPTIPVEPAPVPEPVLEPVVEPTPVPTPPIVEPTPEPILVPSLPVEEEPAPKEESSLAMIIAWTVVIGVLMGLAVFLLVKYRRKRQHK